MKHVTTTLALSLTALMVAACSRAPKYAAPIPAVNDKPRVLFALSAVDTRVGTGSPVTAGSCIFAHYTGWTTDGKKFDSSRDTTNAGVAKNPISFPQGFRRVIAGWDAGFEGMRVGGARRLIIPYQLGYGEKGRPPVIPPSATLIFDVEVMQVTDTLPRPEGAPRGAGTAPPCPAWGAVKP
jgi:peptidylprolyl isomerase